MKALANTEEGGESTVDVIQMERMRNNCEEKRHWKREHKLEIEKMRKSDKETIIMKLLPRQRKRESIDLNRENEKLGEKTVQVFMQTGVMHGLNDHRTYGTPLPIAEHHHYYNHLHYRNT